MDRHRTRDLCLTTGVYASSCACAAEAPILAQTHFPACPECGGTVLWRFVRSAPVGREAGGLPAPPTDRSCAPQRPPEPS